MLGILIKLLSVVFSIESSNSNNPVNVNINNDETRLASDFNYFDLKKGEIDKIKCLCVNRNRNVLIDTRNYLSNQLLFDTMDGRTIYLQSGNIIEAMNYIINYFIQFLGIEATNSFYSNEYYRNLKFSILSNSDAEQRLNFEFGEVRNLLNMCRNGDVDNKGILNEFLRAIETYVIQKCGFDLFSIYLKPSVTLNPNNIVNGIVSYRSLRIFLFDVLSKYIYIFHVTCNYFTHREYISNSTAIWGIHIRDIITWMEAIVKWRIVASRLNYIHSLDYPDQLNFSTHMMLYSINVDDICESLSEKIGYILRIELNEFLNNNINTLLCYMEPAYGNYEITIDNKIYILKKSPFDENLLLEMNVDLMYSIKSNPIKKAGYLAKVRGPKYLNVPTDLFFITIKEKSDCILDFIRLDVKFFDNNEDQMMYFF